MKQPSSENDVFQIGHYVTKQKMSIYFYRGAIFIRQLMGLPNLVDRSLIAEISEKVQPPRNMTSLHFDPG